jgi:anti-anti-sigma factor
MGKELPMATFMIDARDSVTILRLSDDELASLESMEAIHATLATAVKQSGTRNVLIDLQDAAFLTSAMIGQLIQLVQRCKSSNLNIKFCRPNAAIRDVMRIIWFDKLADVYLTEKEALQAFRAENSSPVIVNFQSHDAHHQVAELRTQADEGDAESQYRLGWCLENGYGVGQNSHDAFRFYSLSAMQAYPDALLALATFHAYGITVPQNYAEATRLYQRAAELGLPDAQYVTGMNYDFGIGVKESRNTAVEWYRKAAAQGHERAQEVLAEEARQAG